jgi:hypothetical protein
MKAREFLPEASNIWEVKDYWKDVYPSVAKIEDIVYSKKYYSEFTPEDLQKILELSKITGRREKLTKGATVGQVIDDIKNALLEKSKKQGTLPEFTGRASTAYDLANQIAAHTNGEYLFSKGRTWTTGYGSRFVDPSDFVQYKDKASYDDAYEWVASKGKQIHYQQGSSVRTAIQIGKFAVEQSIKEYGVFSSSPRVVYTLSVRSASSLAQGTRTKVDITDQQAASLKDIADTKNANSFELIKTILGTIKGEQEIKRIIDQSSKITPSDKAKLDKIILGAANFTEPKDTSP